MEGRTENFTPRGIHPWGTKTPLGSKFAPRGKVNNGPLASVHKIANVQEEEHRRPGVSQQQRGQPELRGEEIKNKERIRIDVTIVKLFSPEKKLAIFVQLLLPEKKLPIFVKLFSPEKKLAIFFLSFSCSRKNMITTFSKKICGNRRK
jgi:hypothetical protein